MAFDMTIILSIAGAFGAASTAQYISHHLTLKREDEKYKKERYQNFHSPLIFKVINYLYAEECHRGNVNLSSVPKPDTILKEILVIIEKNLRYADSKLVEIYESSKLKELIENPPDENDHFNRFNKLMEFSTRIIVFEEFLNEYITISKELNVLSVALERNILGYIAICRMFKLTSGYAFGEISEIVITYGSYIVSLMKNSYPGLLQKIDDVETEIKISREICKRNTGRVEFYCLEPLVNLFREIEMEANKYPIYSSHLGNPLKEAIEGDISELGFFYRR